MRAIMRTDEGVIELNYMWLPTWLGMNSVVKKQLGDKLAPSFVGRTIDEAELDKMNDETIDAIVAMFPLMDGLRDYLDGLKFVHIRAKGSGSAD